MAYNTVQVVLNLTDGGGAQIQAGAVSIAPSAVLTDAADRLLAVSPVWAQFPGTPTAPQVTLLATDNANISPSGWAWTVTFHSVPGNPASYSFALPAGPQTFTATNASPCVFTGSGAGYVNNTGVQLTGGSLPG